MKSWLCSIVFLQITGFIFIRICQLQKLLNVWSSRSYLQDFATETSISQLKVIVVDDFFLSPLSYADPFRIHGTELRTLEEVEDYLLQPLEKVGVEATAKVLHCYRKVGLLGIETSSFGS